MTLPEVPAGAGDPITEEIKDHLAETIKRISPLSRDLSRGLQFGLSIQYDAQGQDGLLETILIRTSPDAPPESDLYYLGAVLGSIGLRESLKGNY